MYTQYTIFVIRKKITPDYSKSAAMGFVFLGTQERVRNSRGNRAISVRGTEVLLYICCASVRSYFVLSYWYYKISDIAS